jgi:hypothetical protein
MINKLLLTITLASILVAGIATYKALSKGESTHSVSHVTRHAY